jgi:hypothetical protein
MTVRRQTPQPLASRVVAVAYLLAVICVVVPPAVLGALFAGVVLLRRGLRGHGAAVVVLALSCASLGIVLLR